LGSPLEVEEVLPPELVGLLELDEGEQPSARISTKRHRNERRSIV
jgi:hypothetical protein